MLWWSLGRDRKKGVSFLNLKGVSFLLSGKWLYITGRNWKGCPFLVVGWCLIMLWVLFYVGFEFRVVWKRDLTCLRWMVHQIKSLRAKRCLRGRHWTPMLGHPKAMHTQSGWHLRRDWRDGGIGRNRANKVAFIDATEVTIPRAFIWLRFMGTRTWEEMLILRYKGKATLTSQHHEENIQRN